MSDAPGVEIPKNDPPPERDDTPAEIDLPMPPMPTPTQPMDDGSHPR